MLNTLRYPEEIKEVDELGLPQAAIKPGLSAKEVDMAVQLVEGMSDDWHPDQYHDQYRADLLKLIDRKIKRARRIPSTRRWMMKNNRCRVQPMCSI